LFEIGCNYSGELFSLTKVALQFQDAGNVTTLAGYLQLLDEGGFPVEDFLTVDFKKVAGMTIPCAVVVESADWPISRKS
jgi:hypothetical protein